MKEKKEKISLQSLDVGLKKLEAEIRKLGVLMESMDGRLSLVIEGYIGHDSRIVALENKVSVLQKGR